MSYLEAGLIKEISEVVSEWYHHPHHHTPFIACIIMEYTRRQRAQWWCEKKKKMKIALLLFASIGVASATYGVDLSTATSVDDFSCLVSSGYSFTVVRVFRVNYQSLNRYISFNKYYPTGSLFLIFFYVLIIIIP